MTIGLVHLAAALVLHQMPNLEQLRWQNRVLLLFAPDTTDQALVQQKRLLENAAAGLAERDLKVFEITADSGRERELRSRFQIPSQEFTVMLIGKDGSGKLSRHKPVSPAEIFALIDSMPMRRDEMQQRK